MVREGGTGIGRGRKVGRMSGERRSVRPFSRVPGQGRAVGFHLPFPGHRLCSRFSSPDSRTKKKERAVAFRLPGAGAKPCSRFSFPVSRAKAAQSLSLLGCRAKAVQLVFVSRFPGEAVRTILPDALRRRPPFPVPCRPGVPRRGDPPRNGRPVGGQGTYL